MSAVPLIQRPGARRLLLPLVFLVAALGLYANALHNPFHFDDAHGIAQNHYLHDPGILKDVFVPSAGRHYFAPTEPTATHYRPMLLVSYLFNFMVTGDGVAGFHLVNLLLHVACALMLVALSRRLGVPGPWAVATGAVFLVTPFHTEAVNYITARSSVLSATFMLGALLLFIAARQGRGAGRYARLGGAFACTLAAVLTKEVAVVTPALFLLYDLLYPPPAARRYGLHGYGLHAAALGLALGFLVWQGHLAYLLKVAGGGVGPRGIGENLWLQAMVLAKFLWLMLVPVGLSVVHAFPAAGPSLPAAVCGLLLLGITAGAVAVWRKIPAAAFGWGLFLIALAPTTLLPMNTPLQESRGYLAAAGILLAVGAILAAWRPLLPERRSLVAVAVVVAVLGTGTVLRNPVWGSNLSLWRDAVAKAPGDFRAHANLGTALQEGGDLPGAVAEYRKSIAIYPNEASVHSDLGSALERLGDMTGARQALAEAIRLYPRYAPAHFNLGVVQEIEGDLNAARASYQRAIELRPRYPEALTNLGITLARGGDLPAGIVRMEQALNFDPGSPTIYANLIIAYRAAGRFDDARALYRRAEANGAVSPPLEQIYRSLPPSAGIGGTRTPSAAPTDRP